MIATHLKIRIYGDPCLRKKSQPVKDVGMSERMLILSMIETMHQQKGIGLAAPQVGINQQIVVVDIGEGLLTLINPKVIHRKGRSVMEEGCLSLPGVVVHVRRPQEIWVEYWDEHKRPHKQHCSELLARVIQHETDHVHGKLIVDYTPWGEKLRVRRQLKELLTYGKVLEPATAHRLVKKNP